MSDHPLTQFRAKAGQTLEEFGKLIGATKGAVSKWENGKAVPRRAYVAKITEITKGKVTPADFYEAAQ